MEEDAERRDFTINALYYCPIDHQVIDYVGAYPDLRHRRLKTLGRAETSFAEDPVRMIRAVKYASLLGFPFPLSLGGLVRRMRESVLSCSRERVTEEVYKILTSGAATEILELANKLRLFEIIFPAHALRLRGTRGRLADSALGARLKELDAQCAAGTVLDRADMFGFLFSDLAVEQKELLDDPEPDLQIQRFIREASAPLFPSKKDLATAAESILKTVHPHRQAARAARPGGRPQGAGSGSGEEAAEARGQGQEKGDRAARSRADGLRTCPVQGPWRTVKGDRGCYFAVAILFSRASTLSP